MSNALAKINARVKVLAKKHPKSKRTTLQKQAGREYRAGKLGRVKKKRVVGAKKKRVARGYGKVRKKRVGAIRTNRDTTDRKNTTITIGSVSGHVSAAKKRLQYDIGMAEASKLNAKTKTSKRKIQKRINEKKVLYRKLC